MSNKILCLDFDGVIHSYATGWKGADIIPDPPVEGAFDFIKKALVHFDVHIYSSRSNQPNGIEAMINWFNEFGGEDIIDKVIFDVLKPPAFVTIDDRAITFTGEWPDVDELLAFKPWNKINVR